MILIGNMPCQKDRRVYPEQAHVSKQLTSINYKSFVPIIFLSRIKEMTASVVVGVILLSQYQILSIIASSEDSELF